MKNINKNAVQAISLDGKAYLAHKSFENFSVGAGDFTIEVLFICSSISDCFFYAQEQGFEFGIKEGCLYFQLEGFGSIEQNEGITLEPDALYFAAVSCKDGALSLYFQGLPVAETIEVKRTDTVNTGKYLIGKGLDGYIVEVRMRSCGMIDQEILSDCGMGLRDCDSIEFWSDFTTVQYKDKSSNALSLWTNDGIILCANVTSCMQLSSNGGFATIIKQSYEKGYTLLFKIFPKLENNNIMYVYSAVSSEGRAVFSVGLQSDEGGYKHVFVEHNGASYLGKSPLQLGQWIDVALRIESAEAKVYIDGIDEMTFPFTGDLINVTAMIGVKPFTKKINFKNSFNGYLDYFAEFECALDPDKIDFYAEEQPYIFDDSIRTLYAFYCGEPIDLTSGCTMFKVGQSKALFEKNLNPLDVPTGMDLRVPHEICAEWKELSEYEQWATTAAMDMVRETYSQSMGLTVPEGMVPIEQTATKQIRQIFEEEIYEAKTVCPPEKEEEKALSFIAGALPIAIGGLGMAVALGGATAVAGTAAIGTIMNIKTVKAVKSVLIVSGVVATLAVTLTIIENDSKKEKPEDKNGVLKLVSVCCNHDGDPKNGSIHFHSDDKLLSPVSMVYTVTNNFSIDMLLVTTQIESLCVKCVLSNTSDKTVTGIFGLKCQVFRAFIEQEVTIPPLSSIPVTLCIQLKNKEYNALAKYLQDGWQFFFNELVMCYCTANVYLQKDLPVEPWESHIREPYCSDIKEYPSLFFIKKMILIPETPQKSGKQMHYVKLNDRTKELFNNILNKLYNSGILEYDYETHYTTFSMCGFRILQFLVALGGESVRVNCTDCANITSLIAAQLGIKMDMNLILGIEGFVCNQIMSIPNAEWHDEAFSYHQVAFYSEGGNFNKNAEIYDLSLKIDAGRCPSARFNYDEKEEFLSGGYNAYELEGFKIEPVEPYYKQYYLERLVQYGQIADFTSKQVHTQLFLDMQVGEPDELYTILMQHYIQSYKLEDQKYADEISQSAEQPLILQKIGLEAKRESHYKCEWSAPDGWKVTWFRNADHLPAGKYLASILMRYSCRLTEKEAPELGERVFYGPDLLITYFEGSAYSINCKDMEKAGIIARKLQNNMV